MLAVPGAKEVLEMLILRRGSCLALQKEQMVRGASYRQRQKRLAGTDIPLDIPYISASDEGHV